MDNIFIYYHECVHGRLSQSPRLPSNKLQESPQAPNPFHLTRAALYHILHLKWINGEKDGQKS